MAQTRIETYVLFLDNKCFLYIQLTIVDSYWHFFILWFILLLYLFTMLYCIYRIVFFILFIIYFVFFWNWKYYVGYKYVDFKISSSCR